MTKSVYLDYHATTPVDPRVLEAMLPYFTLHFGNVASQHGYGKRVMKDCDYARKQVASLLHAKPEEIVFTSGATESNNLALKGVAEALETKGKHIISCVTEHKSVLDTLKYLEKKGFVVTILPVDASGKIRLDDLQRSIRLGHSGSDRTILVTIMGANNEIGTIQPIQQISQLCKSNDILLHVDGAQTIGKIPFDVKACGVDLLSLSGHKMYAAKGIGALYVNSQLCRSRICIQLHGGGQEFGMRAGTLPVPLVMGLGAAAQICEQELTEEATHLARLRNKLLAGLQSLGSITVNGHPSERLPGNLNVTFHNLDGERLILGLKDLAVSSSSACSSGAATVSHVLKALGRTEEEAKATLRFGLGRFTSDDDIERAILTVTEVVIRLRHTAERLRQKHGLRKRLTAG